MSEEIVVKYTPAAGADRVTVPRGGKFAGIYYDPATLQHYAVVHHPIEIGAAVEVASTKVAGGTMSVGVRLVDADPTP